MVEIDRSIPQESLTEDQSQRCRYFRLTSKQELHIDVQEGPAPLRTQTHRQVVLADAMGSLEIKDEGLPSR